MKKSPTYFKLLAFVALFLTMGFAQAQCVAGFTYSMGPNGSVNLFNTSTSTNTTVVSYCQWGFGNGTYTVTPSTSPVITTYTANGTYTVQMFFYNSTCTVSTNQTIVITNVTTPSCNIVASYYATAGSNGSYSFHSTSTGTVSGTTNFWNFGDGTTSTSLSPSHTYTANGMYTTTLTVNNNTTPTCMSAYTVVVNVTNACNLTANFSNFTATNSWNAGWTIFTATTSPASSTATSFYWTFGNGSTATVTGWPQDSTQYTTNGIYTVTLYVYQNGCSTSVTHTVSITGNTVTPPCTINANFNATQGTGSVSPTSFVFQSTSTGTTSGTSYSWAFGDGGTGSGAVTAHNYAMNGTYIVTLTASNSSICTSSHTLAVVVNTVGCNLVAGIAYTLNANGNVSFNSTTAGTTSSTYYSWAFGDGNYAYTGSTSHTYANGTYWVMLTANNASVTPACQDTAMVQITVTSNTCVANANFSMTPSGSPHMWNAIPSNTAGIGAAMWQWGDGTSSFGLFTSHTYTAAGNYSVCLTVTTTCGAIGTYCYFGYLSRSAEDNSVITVNVVSSNNIATGIVNNTAEHIAYTISPNPANGQFNISMKGLSAAKAKISVYDLVGKSVYEADSDVSNGTLVKDVQLNEVSNGVYFIKVISDNQTYTKKIIIAK